MFLHLTASSEPVPQLPEGEKHHATLLCQPQIAGGMPLIIELLARAISEGHANSYMDLYNQVGKVREEKAFSHDEVVSLIYSLRFQRQPDEHEPRFSQRDCLQVTSTSTVLQQVRHIPGQPVGAERGSSDAAMVSEALPRRSSMDVVTQQDMLRRSLQDSAMRRTLTDKDGARALAHLLYSSSEKPLFLGEVARPLKLRVVDPKTRWQSYVMFGRTDTTEAYMTTALHRIFYDGLPFDLSQVQPGEGLKVQSGETSQEASQPHQPMSVINLLSKTPPMPTASRDLSVRGDVDSSAVENWHFEEPSNPVREWLLAIRTAAGRMPLPLAYVISTVLENAYPDKNLSSEQLDEEDERVTEGSILEWLTLLGMLDAPAINSRRRDHTVERESDSPVEHESDSTVERESDSGFDEFSSISFEVGKTTSCTYAAACRPDLYGGRPEREKWQKSMVIVASYLSEWIAKRLDSKRERTREDTMLAIVVGVDMCERLCMLVPPITREISRAIRKLSLVLVDALEWQRQLKELSQQFLYSTMLSVEGQ